MDTETGSQSELEPLVKSRFYYQIPPSTGKLHIYEVVEPRNLYSILVRMVYPEFYEDGFSILGHDPFPVNTKDFTDLCTPISEEDIPLLILGEI